MSEISADFIDVAIIGGGPAGLAAAAALARQLHTAVVFDSGSYRNAGATHMHMVPGWENKDPAEFRKRARDDVISHYDTIKFVDGQVAKIEKHNDSHFCLTDGNGKDWNFRKVILAVGSADTFPDIPGYANLWTKKIFHCLFCHGYEDRGAPSVGVLGVSPVSLAPFVIHMAENASQLSKTITIYTNGNQELSGQIKGAIATSAASTWVIEDRQIKSLTESQQGKSVTVEFADNSTKEETFLVHNPLTTVKGPFVEQLGLSLTPMGDIQADAPFHLTSVRGVFAAGDCITPYKAIPGAISSGCNAAVAAASHIQGEKLGLPSMF